MLKIGFCQDTYENSLHNAGNLVENSNKYFLKGIVKLNIIRFQVALLLSF